MTSTATVARQERFGTAYRGAGSHSSAVPDDSEHPNGAAGYEPAGYEPVDRPRLPSLDLEAPPEPPLHTDSWLGTGNGNGDLADHPLLRGLLLELPPKGSTPPPGWLDRWFEATRSILELLYVQNRS